MAPPPFIRRLVLLANTTTPISPPAGVSNVNVGNATSADLTVYSADGQDDPTRALVISSGYERPIPTTPPAHGFVPTEVAFYLRSTPGGTVVLLWY